MINTIDRTNYSTDVEQTQGATAFSELVDVIGGAQDKEQRDTVIKLPKNVRVPDYLGRLLTNTVRPIIIDPQFLLKLGEDVLVAKIADAELFNMSVKSGKRRVPTKLDFEDVAVIMMALYTFRTIQMTDRVEDRILAVYDDGNYFGKRGVYCTATDYLYTIMGRVAPDFKRRDMDDVLDKIERDVDLVEQCREPHLYAVNNGIYNQKSRKLEPFTPDRVFLTKIPVNYVESPNNPVITAPDGYKWDVDSWLHDIASNDYEVSELLWQVVADCLQPQRSRNKSIWFYSDRGNNGKGTVGQMIKNLLGRGNYSSLSVVDFSHEFMKSTLLGVAANIADENDVNMYIDSVKDYKASVTGDDININRKYEAPLRIQFTGTNIQMMNGLPKTRDKSDSFYRRLIIVPFLKSFTNNGERTYIKSDYIARQDVLEYVLHKALNTVFDEYIVPSISAKLIDSYKETNNPVLEWWGEVKDEFVWDLLPNGFLYDLYKSWADRNNPTGKVMARRTFLDTLRGVIETEGDAWSHENNPVRTSDKMDGDEPLITEYGLDRVGRNGMVSEWTRSGYSGDSDEKRREFKRKDRYRGFVRL